MDILFIVIEFILSLMLVFVGLSALAAMCILFYLHKHKIKADDRL